MTQFHLVPQAQMLQPGQIVRVEILGKPVAVCRVGNEWHAFGDTCPHAGAPLSSGRLVGNEVICPFHGARFDVTSGRPCGGPAMGGVASYRVRVTGTGVEVEID